MPVVKLIERGKPKEYERVDTPIRWHGGKGMLVSKLLPLVPRSYRNYVEPCAGGLSLLLALNPDGVSEVVNDLDGEVANFWTVLANERLFDAFARKAQSFGVSEWLYKASDVILSHVKTDTIVAADQVANAFAFFVRCRQSLGGRMATFHPITASRLRRGMNEQASMWLSAVDGLPEVHARVRRVVVLNRDALEVIRKLDTPDTFFYVDAPYLHDTRTAKDVYANECDRDWHERLLVLLGGIEGKFMLSGYDSPLYDAHARAKRWNVVRFETANHAAGGKSKRKMVECVWRNYTADRRAA